MNDLIDTTEMYLRTIYELEEEGVVPLRARIVERLGQSGPTVSQTVARMERDGLLVDVIGLDWEHVHAEACRWEHVMSEAVERRLVELLGYPTTSPYGNPIPGLDELGVGEPAAPAEPGLERMDEVARRGGGRVEVRRIAEHVQLDPELMAQLKSIGVVPGSEVDIAGASTPTGAVAVRGSNSGTELRQSVAHAVLVRAC